MKLHWPINKDIFLTDKLNKDNLVTNTAFFHVYRRKGCAEHSCILVNYFWAWED